MVRRGGSNGDADASTKHEFKKIDRQSLTLVIGDDKIPTP
jgi:hypothetical protein